jgi:hypothetical protein
MPYILDARSLEDFDGLLLKNFAVSLPGKQEPVKVKTQDAAPVHSLPRASIKDAVYGDLPIDMDASPCKVPRVHKVVACRSICFNTDEVLDMPVVEAACEQVLTAPKRSTQSVVETVSVPQRNPIKEVVYGHLSEVPCQAPAPAVKVEEVVNQVEHFKAFIHGKPEQSISASKVAVPAKRVASPALSWKCRGMHELDLL